MNVICVQCDTAYQGTVWMYEYVEKQNDSRSKEVHWFCFDVCADNLRVELRLDESSNRYHFYECFPHVSYNRESEREETNEAKLFQLLRRGASDPSKKLAIIIDSFSTLSNENDSRVADAVLREIYSNRRNTSDSATQLFLTLRENAWLQATVLVRHLRYLANVWSTVTDDAVSLRVKKSNGRIVKEVYEYSDEVNGNGGHFSLVKKSNVTRTKSEKMCENDLCSFKLDLTEQEKKARNAVQLPYVRDCDNNEMDQTTTAAAAETKIHYNPDENDDWDEEDPDNDLEFV